MWGGCSFCLVNVPYSFGVSGGWNMTLTSTRLWPRERNNITLTAARPSEEEESSSSISPWSSCPSVTQRGNFILDLLLTSSPNNHGQSLPFADPTFDLSICPLRISISKQATASTLHPQSSPKASPQPTSTPRRRSSLSNMCFGTTFHYDCEHVFIYYIDKCIKAKCNDSTSFKVVQREKLCDRCQMQLESLEKLQLKRKRTSSQSEEPESNAKRATIENSPYNQNDSVTIRKVLFAGKYWEVQAALRNQY